VIKSNTRLAGETLQAAYKSIPLKKNNKEKTLRQNENRY